jgi:hypothetical protein
MPKRRDESASGVRAAKYSPGPRLPDKAENNLTFSKFAALVPERKLAEAEEALGIGLKNSVFLRESVLRYLWQFYLDTLPGREAKANPAKYHKLLDQASNLSSQLGQVAGMIWEAGDWNVLKNLTDFVRIKMPAGGSHPSGIGLIAVLDEFSNRTRWLYQLTGPGKGGRPRQGAFDRLVEGLTDIYLAGEKQRTQPGNYEHFVRAASVDILSSIQARVGLPTGSFPNEKSGARRFRERLRAVNAARARRSATNPP